MLELEGLAVYCILVWLCALQIHSRKIGFQQPTVNLQCLWRYVILINETSRQCTRSLPGSSVHSSKNMDNQQPPNVPGLVCGLILDRAFFKSACYYAYHLLEGFHCQHLVAICLYKITGWFVFSFREDVSFVITNIIHQTNTSFGWRLACWEAQCFEVMVVEMFADVWASSFFLKKMCTFSRTW